MDNPQRTPEHSSELDEPYADSVAGAAVYSSLSEVEIRRLVAAGKVEAKRHGRRVLIVRRSLREYLDGLPAA